MYLKLLILGLLFVGPTQTLLAFDPGFRVPFRFFEPEALLYEKGPSADQVTKYIAKMAADRSEQLISNKMLARELLFVSKCFDIDPYVFIGLVHTESHFNNSATSISGAVGFTQFTNIGLTEVHDQLGERGKTGAIESTIEFWKSIFTSCIDPEWVPLWKRTAHLDEDKINLYQKKILKTDPALSLSYGALLLKLYWGRQSQVWEDSTEATKYDVFFRALARYNGEPDGRAEAYAKKVLDRAQAFYDFVNE